MKERYANKSLEQMQEMNCSAEEICEWKYDRLTIKNKDAIRTLKSFFYGWWKEKSDNWHGRVDNAYNEQEKEQQKEQEQRKLIQMMQAQMQVQQKEMQVQKKVMQQQTQRMNDLQELNEKLEEKLEGDGSTGSSEEEAIAEYMDDANTLYEIESKLTEMITHQANLLIKSDGDPEFESAVEFIRNISGYEEDVVKNVNESWKELFQPSRLYRSHTKYFKSDIDFTQINKDTVAKQAKENALTILPKVLKSILTSNGGKQSEFTHDIYLSQISNLLKSEVGGYPNIDTRTEVKERRKKLKDVGNVLICCSLSEETLSEKIRKDIAHIDFILDGLTKGVIQCDMASTVGPSAAPSKLASCLKGSGNEKEEKEEKSVGIEIKEFILQDSANEGDLGQILKRKLKNMSKEDKAELKIKSEINSLKTPPATPVTLHSPPPRHSRSNMTMFAPTVSIATPPASSGACEKQTTAEKYMNALVAKNTAGNKGDLRGEIEEKAGADKENMKSNQIESK
jgi:hypothetical protein